MRRFGLAAFLVACTTSPNPDPNPTPDTMALQMNDITTLFPLATNAVDFDSYLTASSLLPEALFQADPNTVISYDSLRVVGVRFDPCFANVGPITDPSTCDNQIRLVFQPLTFDNGSNMTFAQDEAVHVSYALTRDQLIAATQAIAAAREQATSGDLGPLAAHPLIAQQGLSGAYAQTLRGIITSYANAAKIERLTTFFLEETLAGSPAIEGSGSDGPPLQIGLFWDMHGFSVAGEVETPLQIGSLDQGTTDMNISASTDPLDAFLSPTTDGSDNLSLLANATNAGSASPSQRQAAFDAALRIENPNHDSANTIDCASCHMAEPERVLVAQPMFGMSSTGDANAFVADSSIPAADLVQTTTTFVDPSDGGLDIHAFSYRTTLPVINQRVINETAANLAYLNSLVQP
jgi:hypothetical protein